MKQILFLLFIFPFLVQAQSRKLVIYEQIAIDKNNIIVEPADVNQQFETLIIYSRTNPRLYTFDTFGQATFSRDGIDFKVYQIDEFIMSKGKVRDGRRVFNLKVKFTGGEHNYEIFEIR